MNKQKLYVESTIPSYIMARDSRDVVHLGHQIVTRAFWENERNRFSLFVSRIVLDECGRGDPDAAKRRLQLVEGIELLKMTDQAKELSLIYQKLLGIPERAKNDSIHLALCVVHEINFLLTWNCVHLGPTVQVKVKDYNEKNGLWTPVLVTPDTIAEIIAKGEL